MMKKIEAHVGIQKIIANVSPEFRKEWKLPEDHESVGLVSCDNEDVMFLALDDATKKARIRVMHAQTVWVGKENDWGKFQDANTAMISGPRVQDVKSGLSHIREYIERKCSHYQSDINPGISWYADWVPRVGPYMQDRLGIPEGSSYCYLYGPPIESTYAIDAAMKAGNTRLARTSDIITRDNKIGVILYGSESACKSAVSTYNNVIERCAARPLDLEV